MTGGPSLDPPVYRPFALLAFAAILLLGAPLGMWLLMRPAGAAASLIWLHVAVQLFGFLATLIVGVAHHLLPRFTGRAVRPTALTSWLFAGLAVALVLRVAGAIPADPDTRGTAASMARASLGRALDARGRARSPDRPGSVPLGWHAVAPLIAASGVLAWAAFACAGLSLVSRPRGRPAAD
jgi:hypothetical protein